MIRRNSEISEHLVHVHELVFDDGAELFATIAGAATRGDHDWISEPDGVGTGW